jgi:DNA-binding beta-propeller fold protein YncE
MRHLQLLVTVGIALVSTGCASIGTVDTLDPERLSWPIEDPKVRMERVISTRHDIGGGGFSWLGGRRDEALFVRPYGIAWQGESLLVADPGAGRAVRIPARGRMLVTKESLFTGPMGVTVCAGSIVVSDARAGTVALLDDDLGLRKWLARDLDRPTGIACLDQTIVVAETGRHRLLLFAPDGSRRAIGQRGDGDGEFNFPTSVTAGNGKLWVGDTLNFRVQLIDPESGKGMASFGQLGDAAGEMPRIKGVAIDRDGHLWVSDAFLDQVSLYTDTGELLLSLGRTGSEPGELAFPAGVAAHADGRVAVVDSLNRRVQVFRLIGDDAVDGGNDG